MALSASAQPDRRRRRDPAHVAGIAALACGAVLACGKTGPLRPPAPRGPLPAHAVDARQIGNRVEIAFFVPAPRGTDPSQAVERAEVLRVAYPPGMIPPADPDAFRVRGEVVAQVSSRVAKPGDRIVIADPSVAELGGGGIGWTLRYGVRVRDQRDRPSALVIARDLATLPPAPAPGGLRGHATADGVRLEWDAPPEAPVSSYNVYRGPAEGLLSEQPLNIQPLTGPSFLDPTAETGRTYRYVVRAVAAEGVPYRESASSAELVVNASDTFAPAAPTGLVAVQEGAAVRLLWNPGTARDLDGYRVYRARGDAPWDRIGADVVRQPSFLDPDVRAGESVRYRITAVDRAVPANESEPSAEASLKVVADPGTPSGAR